ncbi:hypothetical protein KIPB_007620 [Kipferlia bialata]|uniref:Uncharacterized protein n=1 Tax=Kipferlia bialata TaxID=797122 RepID=A0A9K3CZ25_9EUKA|nr:hypothetical protein KIPB_007620 [Kipferlia bialata]|eukprot:g7620.t1
MLKPRKLRRFFPKSIEVLLDGRLLGVRDIAYAEKVFRNSPGREAFCVALNQSRVGVCELSDAPFQQLCGLFHSCLDAMVKRPDTSGMGYGSGVLLLTMAGTYYTVQNGERDYVSAHLREHPSLVQDTHLWGQMLVSEIKRELRQQAEMNAQGGGVCDADTLQDQRHATYMSVLSSFCYQMRVYGVPLDRVLVFLKYMADHSGLSGESLSSLHASVEDTAHMLEGSVFRGKGDLTPAEVKAVWLERKRVQHERELIKRHTLRHNQAVLQGGEPLLLPGSLEDQPNVLSEMDGSSAGSLSVLEDDLEGDGMYRERERERERDGGVEQDAMAHLLVTSPMPHHLSVCTREHSLDNGALTPERRGGGIERETPQGSPHGAGPHTEGGIEGGAFSTDDWPWPWN